MSKQLLTATWTTRTAIASKSQTATVCAGPYLIAKILTDEHEDEIAGHIATIHNAHLDEAGRQAAGTNDAAKIAGLDAMIGTLDANLIEARAEAAALAELNSTLADDNARLRTEARNDRRAAATKLQQAENEAADLRDRLKIETHRAETWRVSEHATKSKLQRAENEAAGLRIEVAGLGAELAKQGAIIDAQARALAGLAPAGMLPIEIGRRLAELRRRLIEDAEAGPTLPAGETALLYDVARALDLSHEHAAAVVGETPAGRPANDIVFAEAIEEHRQNQPAPNTGQWFRIGPGGKLTPATEPAPDAAAELAAAEELIAEQTAQISRQAAEIGRLQKASKAHPDEAAVHAAEVDELRVMANGRMDDLDQQIAHLITLIAGLDRRIGRIEDDSHTHA